MQEILKFIDGTYTNKDILLNWNIEYWKYPPQVFSVIFGTTWTVRQINGYLIIASILMMLGVYLRVFKIK